MGEYIGSVIYTQHLTSEDEEGLTVQITIEACPQERYL